MNNKDAKRKSNCYGFNGQKALAWRRAIAKERAELFKPQKISHKRDLSLESEEDSI